MRYFNFITAVILALHYAAGNIPPSEDYNLWLIPFVIPFALATNVLLLLISLVLKKKSSIYYIIALVIGSNYLISTIGLKHVFKKEKDLQGSFSVINYNVQSPDGPSSADAFHNPDSVTWAFQNWILNNEADIQCYQEFSNYFGNDNFDFIKKLNDKGYFTYFSFDSARLWRGVVGGVLIASKFPIMKEGLVISSKNGTNRITYADLKRGNDTLRIINVHLESMGLKQYHPGYTSGFESRKENTRIIFQKLKEGVFERSSQIKILSTFIKNSPHAVICTGDFNDLPYSYSYQFMKKEMRNTFEEVGKGFGFTYNGKTLRTLRIDNQFYSEPLDAIGFKTLHHIDFSDHFPIQGWYKLLPEVQTTQEVRVP